MTVRELIETLQRFNEDYEVVVEEIETGGDQLIESVGCSDTWETFCDFPVVKRVIIYTG